MNTYRLEKEFENLGLLGRGAFGTVSKFRHRLGLSLAYFFIVCFTFSADGVIYAIKRSNKPISGLAEEFEPF